MRNKPDNKIRKTLGEKIRKARENVKFTQDEAARKAQMSSNYFAKIERGEINATFETLYKIIKALKIEASDIFPN
ncbi:MAG TPA: helix-turn-helix transcriptional regulator [Candidatus Saccharimonadales bacterium]|nr:helix-turn-helix transcriptional regulator [Candidatus Saccharimonadales bacterium]